jgi:Icc protein
MSVGFGGGALGGGTFVALDMGMPIHLSQNPGRSVLGEVNRRGALRRIAGSFAGGFAAGSVWADVGKVPSEGVALLSDTHIDGDVSATAMGTNMADNLRTVLGDVLRSRGAVSRVIVNGDCAYKVGLETDYAAFTRLMQPVRATGLPVHVTLGNHDDREQFRKVVLAGRAAKAAEVDKECSVIVGGEVDWVVMDSCTRPVSEGRFGARQLEWLRNRLDSVPNRPVVIVGHHNPREPSSKYPLEDTEEFFSIIVPRRQVKAYVFGHTHRWQVAQHASGLHLVNLPPTAYVFVAGRPNGWVRAVASATGMELELRCVDAGHPQHGERVSLRWRV